LFGIARCWSRAGKLLNILVRAWGFGFWSLVFVLCSLFLEL
jgi:hypothetical protein